ncbi:class I SAM-dependent methyltransferase [Luteococcus sp. OSA5]|uniref:class I SAM-dependent methyltransferase n=1 Tax=Luteococcus sp. OSA5 TaxID=3401630 RepID=UPI003B43476C
MTSTDQLTEREPVSTAEEWDERYSGDRVWSGDPNQALVQELSQLPAGKALDVGCGEGADSVWLAQHGWQVTSLDISPRALERTLSAASRASVAVTGVAAAFLEAVLPTAGFDLVSAMYPVLEKTPEARAERRLVDLVAPGGHLLLVHHVFEGPGHHDTGPAEGRGGPDHERIVLPHDLAAFLEGLEGWQVITNEHREREVSGGGGAHHRVDHVLRARRLH